ncbi:MAG TPA: aminotransferase class I/II-fold pyridoxal phosphate-dependent enzyme [Micromonosporaceae bacterium]
MIDKVKARLTEPTAKGLAAAVSRAIGDGALLPGGKLPPIRTVATRLSLSPTTVSSAWQLLARSGAIHSDGRRGTVVAQPRATGPGRYRQALHHRAAFRLDLATGVPDPLLLPDLGPALRRLHSTVPTSYLDEPVLPALEEALRGTWPFPAERIAVLDGAMDAMDALASAQLRLGDRAVVENPCFPPLLDLLDALGVEVIGVGLDEAGPLPDQLTDALAQRPAAVFLQPRAHNPTGASWTHQRAKELAEVLARAPGTTVIEDDSAGDICATGLVSLGTWLPEQVVHIRSFSKSHGPDLRIAAVGGPAARIDPVLERRLLGQGWTSRLLQHLLLDLLTAPDSIATVATARREYARRRRLITGALRKTGHDVFDGDGINVWLPVRDEQAALISLASAGIGAAGGTGFMTGPPTGHRPHIRITVGLVCSGHAAVAATLARAAETGAQRAPR